MIGRNKVVNDREAEGPEIASSQDDTPLKVEGEETFEVEGEYAPMVAGPEDIHEEPKPKWMVESTPVITTQVENNAVRVYGVSFLGRAHTILNAPCQDYHKYVDLGEGWHLFLVSDGAGSAKESQRGSRIVCEACAKIIERSLTRLNWINESYTPTPLEWQVEFTSVCKHLKDYMEEQISMLDEDVAPKDFNATLMVMIVTPSAMLAGHIGDGRMGYESESGEWISIMHPHKAEESHQTIFVLNAWDRSRVPALRMSECYVPETLVVPSVPKSIMLLSDGCENFSWNCLQYNEQGKVEDINTPFAPFWGALKQEIENAEDPQNAFLGVVDGYSEACRNERDDRTLLFALFHPLSAK